MNKILIQMRTMMKIKMCKIIIIRINKMEEGKQNNLYWTKKMKKL